jgi:hypothetical protein
MAGARLDNFFDLWRAAGDDEKRVILSFVIDNVPMESLSKYINLLDFETRQFLVDNWNLNGRT